MEMLTYAKYAYTTTSVQLRSCSDGYKVVLIPNIFKEAMRLPDPICLKAALDKEMASLEQHHIYELVFSTSIPVGKKSLALSGGTKSRRTRPSREGLLSKAGDRPQEETVAIRLPAFARFRASEWYSQRQESLTII